MLAGIGHGVAVILHALAVVYDFHLGQDIAVAQYHLSTDIQEDNGQIGSIHLHVAVAQVATIVVAALGM